MTDQTLITVMTKGIGTNLTNDEKRGHLIDLKRRERKAGNTSLRRRRLDQDARNVGWSDPSSTENSTGIISFVVTLPFKSFSTRTSC